MCLKLRKENTNPFALVNLIDDDYEIAFELFLFASNIKREVLCCFGYFYFFFKKIKKKKKLTTCF
jgi:hypothetical protein